MDAEAVSVDVKSLCNHQEWIDYPPQVQFFAFDSCVDNHFNALKRISKLCGEPEDDSLDTAYFEKFSSSITFIREWRSFNYTPRAIRFTCFNGSEILNLTQFSAATIPTGSVADGIPSPVSSKDFVMYVGGPIWALDWCPRSHKSQHDITCEFLAVSSHPPESSYHNVGVPLTGRGLIQIWCLVNVMTEEKSSRPPVKGKGRPRKDENVKTKSNATLNPKRPRGRPRKTPANGDKLKCEGKYLQALSAEFAEGSASLIAFDGLTSSDLVVRKNTEGKIKTISDQAYAENLSPNTIQMENGGELGDRDEFVDIHPNEFPEGNTSIVRYKHRRFDDMCTLTGSSDGDYPIPLGNGGAKNPAMHQSGQIHSKSLSLAHTPTKISVPDDLVPPRIMFCLAHNGKVAWDIKWKPHDKFDSKFKHRMGFLAGLLGNGSLEVWEVPSPHVMKFLYSSTMGDSDPRFIKLEPVFRCSKLMYGGRQSMPLTLEWSALEPHDIILAGCHDGTVALWKFSTSDPYDDTRPILCFTADYVPIRAVAWAPVENDPEGANVMVTAGHEGMRFWDIRDPFRPLWDLNPVQKVICSLDWISDPKCVIVSFDDGSMRTLSLVNAANDTLVAGKPLVGAHSQILSGCICSSFSIWSVHSSRKTGMVAYCSADGSVLRFQISAKSVEKDPYRSRAPHFLCASLKEEDSCLTLDVSLSNTPLLMKGSDDDWGQTQRIFRGSNKEKRAGKEKGKYDAAAGGSRILAIWYGEEGEEGEGEEVGCEGLKKKDEGGERRGADVFPPNSVAMHRVRWNMNNGSERWLSYGGASGLLVCQQITTSSSSL